LVFFFIVLGISFNPGRFLLELCIYFDVGRIHTESWAFYSIYVFLLMLGVCTAPWGVLNFVLGILRCWTSPIAWAFVFFWGGGFAFLFTFWAIIEGDCVHSGLYYI
jgi:hypothetical protein